MTDKRFVHIVDDEEAVRRSTSFALRTEGFQVRAWVSGVAFLEEADRIESGCVLLDIRMPEIDGIEVQRLLSERGVTMPVVIMTGHGDIATAVRAMKAGAVDFLEKPFDKASLLGAMDMAFDRLATSAGAAARAADAAAAIARLTPRERDVLEGMAQGLPNKTIAYDLGVSTRTVELHRANLIAKLGGRSLSETLRIAFAAGLGR